ncbi:amino acid permease C-terminal domain-containing protein [Inquilinus sp. CA228]|uniref:amino acid permease C-terminal domain-containing protein n=1 Tax=Inquilinus sp. CA228 TaxID=3455609 RepID=UPI003F8D4250
MVLRQTQPELPLGFKVPFYPVLPVLSLAMCLYLMLSLPIDTILLFAVWLGIAAVIHFSHGVRRSRLARREELPADPPSSSGAEAETVLAGEGNG